MQKNTQKILLGTKSANGLVQTNTAGIEVKDFQNVLIELKTTGSTTATIKFQQSGEVNFVSGFTPVNFANAASYTNPWDYVEVYDNANTTSAIEGATGVVLTGTDVVKYYVLNTNTIQQFSAIVSGYSAGTIQVSLIMTNNA